MSARKPAASAVLYLKARRLRILALYHGHVVRLNRDGFYTKGMRNALGSAANKLFRHALDMAAQYWGSIEIEAALETLGAKRWSTPTWQEYEDYVKERQPKGDES